MNALAPLGYALGLVPGVLAIYGNLRGGPWALGAAIFLIALCAADWIVRDSRRPPPDSDDSTPNVILGLHVVVNSLAIASLLYAVWSGRLPRWRVGDAILSTGLNSGISGIVVAHELIHRRARAWRIAGVWNLLLVNYAHFFIEHIKGHHRHVGTRRDPSTARPGENVYHYLARSLPQQLACALSIEADRLAKRGQARFGARNFVVVTAFAQVGIAATIGLVLGPRVLSAYLWQGAIAVVLLQMVNYLQHSGLERPEGSRVAAAHSWQSDRVSSRFLLLELPRHADHHCHAARPFHELTSHDEGPMLPFGLLGTIPVLLVPPLWFALARRAVARAGILPAGVRNDLGSADVPPTRRARPPAANAPGARIVAGPSENPESLEPESD